MPATNWPTATSWPSATAWPSATSWPGEAAYSIFADPNYLGIYEADNGLATMSVFSAFGSLIASGGSLPPVNTGVIANGVSQSYYSIPASGGGVGSLITTSNAAGVNSWANPVQFVVVGRFTAATANSVLVGTGRLNLANYTGIQYSSATQTLIGGAGPVTTGTTANWQIYDFYAHGAKSQTSFTTNGGSPSAYAALASAGATVGGLTGIRIGSYTTGALQGGVDVAAVYAYRGPHTQQSISALYGRLARYGF